MTPNRHAVLREGAITGVLGASAVALWFLIVDLFAGAPLFTPKTLGTALFGAVTSLLFDFRPVATGWEQELLLVAGYTVFHYAVFIAVGALAVALIHAAEREPALLALFFIFFVVFETGFYGLVAALNAVQLLNGLEWYQIAVGNLLASVLMGGYLWRAHPALAAELSDVLSH